MLLPEHQEDTNNALSSSIQWHCGKSTSGAAPNDRETGQQKTQEVARSSRHNHSRLQFDEVTSHRLFALLFNDGTQASPACRPVISHIMTTTQNQRSTRVRKGFTWPP